MDNETAKKDCERVADHRPMCGYGGWWIRQEFITIHLYIEKLKDMGGQRRLSENLDVTQQQMRHQSA